MKNRVCRVWTEEINMGHDEKKKRSTIIYKEVVIYILLIRVFFK